MIYKIAARADFPDSEQFAKAVLHEQIGSLADVPILRGAHGKPYLQNRAAAFSISHAGEKILCAVHTKNIGADIEKPRGYLDHVAKRICNDTEYAFINGDASRFLQVWTRKEAYVKLIGRGVSFGLKKVVVADRNGLLSHIGEYAVQTDSDGEYVYSLVWEE